MTTFICCHIVLRTHSLAQRQPRESSLHLPSPCSFFTLFCLCFLPLFLSLTHPVSFFFTFYQDRRARRERGRVHDQGHERHEEGPGVPEQGQEEEDYDHVVHDHRRKPRVLHWTQIPWLPINKYNDSYTICLEILWIYTSEGHLI